MMEDLETNCTEFIVSEFNRYMNMDYFGMKKKGVKMKPHEFTTKTAELIKAMNIAGEYPIIHYAFRSAEEQKRLYDAKLSQCDGVTRKSNHQRMLACDIYLTDGKGVIFWEWDEADAKQWHELWESWGGNKMTVFSDGTEDKGHFDAKHD